MESMRGLPDRDVLAPLIRRSLALVCGCLLAGACGSPSSPVSPPSGGGTPGPSGDRPAADATSWGFFAYTGDLVSGLTSARWGRVTANVWSDIERPPGSGSYSWTDLDGRVSNAQASGFSLVLVLKTGNGAAWSDPDCFRRVDAAPASEFPSGRALASCPVQPNMESAWSRLVAEVVERYDGDGTRDMPGLNRSIRVDVEVENEAANPQLWDYGTADRVAAADRYLRLLDLSYNAKQSADPQTQLILAGLYQPNLIARCDAQPSAAGCSAGVQQNVAFSKRVLGRPDLFDAVDMHFFVYYHFEPSYIDSGFQWLVAQMQQRGYSRPIYALEWTGSSLLHITEGYTDAFARYFPYSSSFPTVDAFQAMYVSLDQPANVVYRRWFEAEQGKEFGKLFANLLALGAKRLVHVQYSDFRPGAWDNPWWKWQGIIKYLGAAVRKPSYHTYNLLSQRIAGFTAARRIDRGGDVRLYEFSFAGGDPAYVLWTDGAEGVLDLSSVITRRNVRITPVVTELDSANGPIVPPELTAATNAVPVHDVPALLRGVD